MSALAQAVKSTYGTDQLAGISPVYVVVEELDSDAGLLGITAEDIKTDVEGVLREAKIDLNLTADGQTRGALFVRFRLNCDSTLCGYGIDIGYRETVGAGRAENQVIYVSPVATWEAKGVVGYWEKSDTAFSRVMRAKIKGVVHRFVSAYNRAN